MPPSSNGRLVADDEVEIDLDPEWLPLDALPREGSVLMLLEALGSPAALTLFDDAEKIDLVCDQGDMLEGQGLSSLLGACGPTARLKVVETGGTPRLRALRRLPATELAWPAGESGDFEISGDGLSMAADAFAGRVRNDPLAHLRRQVLELSLVQALDVLMCERELRGIQPFDYQRRVVRRVLGRMRGNAILADEVGLGKTIEAGMTLLEYQARGLVRSTLVLTPPSLVGQWAGELRRHFNVPVVTQDDDSFRQAGEAAWHRFPTLVASLATARREPNRTLLLAAPYDLIIVDEAHHLRNSTTASWSLVSQIRKKFMLLLTATPIQNDLKELFNLVTLLKPGQLGTFKKFKSRFIAPDGAKNVEELRRLLADSMIRNRRSETGLNLPPRTAKTSSIPATTLEAQVYRELADLVRSRKREGWSPLEKLRLKGLQLAAGSSPAALAASLASETGEPSARLRETLRAIDAPAKTMRFLQAIADLEGEKVVVFTQFRATLEHLVGFLQRTGIEFRAFHGGLSRLQKDSAVAEFENDAQILVCTESGSEGWNLQFCRNLINFDLPWNPMRIEQRLGRLHRIGQTREVRVLNLVTQGTLEHELIEVLERKLNLFELVVGEMDLILGDVEEETSFEEIVFDAWSAAADAPAARDSLELLGDRLQESKKAIRFQQELNDSILGGDLGVSKDE